MEHRLDTIAVTLRVLACVTEKRRPEDFDIHAVEILIGLKPAQMSLDAYVDEALRRALEDFRNAQITEEYRTRKHTHALVLTDLTSDPTGALPIALGYTGEDFRPYNGPLTIPT